MDKRLEFTVECPLYMRGGKTISNAYNYKMSCNPDGTKVAIEHFGDDKFIEYGESVTIKTYDANVQLAYKNALRKYKLNKWIQ